MTKNSQFAECTASMRTLAVQSVAVLFGIFGSVSRRRSPGADAGRIQKEDRGSVGLYALVVVGLVVVGAAAFLVVSGGVLNDGTNGGEVNDTDPAPDQDPRPVDDGSDSEDNTSEDDDSGDEADSDGSEENSTEDDPDENTTDSSPELVNRSVEIYTYDLGPADAGEMRLLDYESGEQLRTHNFSDGGHERVFENLEYRNLYKLEIETPYFPPESLTFNPSRTDGKVNETIGYEFQGAESYVMDWEVDKLPTDFEGDHRTEEAEETAITRRGTSKWDGENLYGYYRDDWFRGTTEYYHNATANQTFRNPPLEGYDWRPINSWWGNPSNLRDLVIQNGIADIEERKFVGTKDTYDGEVHMYYIPKEGVGAPFSVGIDPSTGYPTEFKYELDEFEVSDATRIVATYKKQDESVDTFPPDFPENPEEVDE